MKTLFLLPMLLLCLISCSQETADSVVERDGLFYKKFNDTPFTGKLLTYDENGNLATDGRFKNGLKEGEWIRYDVATGKLSEKGSYNNGKKEGEWIRYDVTTGKLSEKGSYNNGKKEGRWRVRGEKGYMISKKYKNGRKVFDPYSPPD